MRSVEDQGRQRLRELAQIVGGDEQRSRRARERRAGTRQHDLRRSRSNNLNAQRAPRPALLAPTAKAARRGSHQLHCEALLSATATMYCSCRRLKACGVRFMIGEAIMRRASVTASGLRSALKRCLTGLDSEDLAKFEKPAGQTVFRGSRRDAERMVP